MEIRMVLAGEFAECLLDLVVGGGPLDTEGFVIIALGHGEWLSGLWCGTTEFHAAVQLGRADGRGSVISCPCLLLRTRHPRPSHRSWPAGRRRHRPHLRPRRARQPQRPSYTFLRPVCARPWSMFASRIRWLRDRRLPSLCAVPRSPR